MTNIHQTFLPLNRLFTVKPVFIYSFSFLFRPSLLLSQYVTSLWIIRILFIYIRCFAFSVSNTHSLPSNSFRTLSFTSLSSYSSLLVCLPLLPYPARVHVPACVYERVCVCVCIRVPVVPLHPDLAFRGPPPVSPVPVTPQREKPTLISSQKLCGIFICFPVPPYGPL